MWKLQMATGAGLVALACCVSGFAGDADIRAELEKVKKEVEELRKEKAASKPVGAGVVDKVVDNKYGPNATVSTKQGKLTISGLVQIWYYSIQNDNLGFFGSRTPALLGGDTNEGKDNDSFAIRRTELKFNMDIHENVTAVVMFDPAAGFRGRPGFNTNLGTSLREATLTAPDVTADSATTRLQDAFVNYHGVIPHHDFTLGQFKPYIPTTNGSSASLDFVERSMIGQLNDARDIGIQAHGTWWDDRFQYWLGAFNTPTSYLAPANQNRADNNDAKSFAARVQLRPLWKDEKWGSLELSGGVQFAFTGEAGEPGGTDGLNITGTDDIRYNAYAIYQPGGPVKGWWLKGEWAWFRGRLRSNKWGLTTIAGVPTWVIGDGTGANPQTGPRAFDTSGWEISTGYKISDSVFAKDVPSWFKPIEFAFRYETFGNIQVADLAMPNERHDVWKSSIFTAGVNYYIKGNNAKIQVNYNWVNEPDQSHDGGTPPRLIREVRNDNLMVNFQVAW
jgi:hypothetical protein